MKNTQTLPFTALVQFPGSFIKGAIMAKLRPEATFLKLEYEANAIPKTKGKSRHIRAQVSMPGPQTGSTDIVTVELCCQQIEQAVALWVQKSGYTLDDTVDENIRLQYDNNDNSTEADDLARFSAGAYIQLPESLPATVADWLEKNPQSVCNARMRVGHLFISQSVAESLNSSAVLLGLEWEATQQPEGRPKGIYAKINTVGPLTICDELIELSLEEQDIGRAVVSMVRRNGYSVDRFSRFFVCDQFNAEDLGSAETIDVIYGALEICLPLYLPSAD